MSGLQLHTSSARVRVAPQQPLRLTGAAGARLQGVSGVLWVTIDHDPDDHVLQVGESLSIDSSRPVLVSALGGPATLAVCAPVAAAAPGRSTRPGLLQQLAHVVAPSLRLSSPATA
ncbi:MAG: DUF2917 domain-containing protein [Burkholderiaceae bacterium]|nr:DUF2917 domain-containing protein [Burkholderiaceae bacterium]